MSFSHNNAHNLFLAHLSNHIVVIFGINETEVLFDILYIFVKISCETDTCNFLDNRYSENWNRYERSILK